MPSVWLVSDTHFGHAGVCRFLRNDGTKLRPWDNPEDMDEAMVKAWNETVRPGDKVYHLGDVVINRRALSTLGRLNGDKVLVKGNHDIFKLEDYLPYFRDIRAYIVQPKAGVIMTHMPIHPESLSRFGLNIHGHLHANRVMKMRGVDVKTGGVLYTNEIDPRYHCVCVEQTDFRPILFEDVLRRSREEGGEPGLKGPATTWPD
jgi:calcineurin-like phosphoesterase family protein